MIIGLLGKARSGKDTSAHFLTSKHLIKAGAVYRDVRPLVPNEFPHLEPLLLRATQIALADPMKWFCHEIFGWPISDLWGPSHRRTPVMRKALQELGTEWGRAQDENVWIHNALRCAEALMGTTDVRPTSRGSFVIDRADQHVVISDVRFQNEVDAIRLAGGIVVRIVRGTGLEGQGGQHASETEQDRVDVDHTILNLGTPEELYAVWASIL